MTGLALFETSILCPGTGRLAASRKQSFERLEHEMTRNLGVVKQAAEAKPGGSVIDEDPVRRLRVGRELKGTSRRYGNPEGSSTVVE